VAVQCKRARGESTLGAYNEACGGKGERIGVGGPIYVYMVINNNPDIILKLLRALSITALRMASR
jgi:hypothetical protein